MLELAQFFSKGNIMSKKSGLSFLWLSAVALVVDLLTKYILVQKFVLY